jgi:hypothetical protein
MAKTIDIDDASTLSMLAYEQAAYGAVKGATDVINRLGSDVARKIAIAIVNPQEPLNLDEETASAVEYFRKWAIETSSRSPQLSSRRPVPRRQTT